MTISSEGGNPSSCQPHLSSYPEREREREKAKDKPIAGMLRSAFPFRRITHDYTLNAAKALSSLGTLQTPFRFIYVSGEGADQSERGRQLFSRIKGRTERALAEMETVSFSTISVRPGVIIPTQEVSARTLLPFPIIPLPFHTIPPRPALDGSHSEL